ncbi:HNH/ENDO VII family nuclease [Patulibacter sp. NPDC049589]|uniref:HNH/ENDO VII family nuclease n=1 Tax=Patulibacter sp. NPDC049589 TaxID=3154731 RepID=UPI00342EE273
MTQREPGSVAEVAQSFHQSNSSVLHINPSNTIPSGIDRGAFQRFKSDYWKKRAGDFE